MLQAVRPQTVFASDTAHILAIMVQFQPDSDTLTSGNGQFVLGEGTGLDAPPHDRTYFQNHLVFLKNYIRKVSSGKLNVVDSVLPAVITLPHQIQYYSPPKNGNGNNLGLLFQDSWHAADSVFSGFEFGRYDCFVIFHAGSGRDIDFTSELGYDPLPRDIPSIYLSLESLREMTAPFGSNYNGAPVDNGSFNITNSIIMPESESYPIVDLTLGTNGLLAASFGSFLGLPDLFDTQTGITGIGRFGLMDGQAIFAYGGIFPPEPSAWEKYYLRWIIPIEVSPSTATQYRLYANETGKYSVLKVPISSTEYFLLENREGDAHHDGEKVTSVYNGGSKTTQITFANDTAYFDGSQIRKIDGVVTDVDEYDWALPQDTSYFGGILIWHIDETVIDANLAGNTVNANPIHRGVGLMEAHGANEIGNFIQTVFGSYYYDGSPYDFWYAGNPLRTSPNKVGGNNFSPTTLPNSNSYDGASSNIYITNFSSHDSLMTFYVNSDSVAANFKVTSGFPKNIHGATSNSSPEFAHLSPDGKLQVVANNGDSLYAFGMDSTSVGFDTTGFFSKVGGRFQPVISSAAASDTVYAMDDSVFYGLVDRDNNHDGTADTIFAKSVLTTLIQSFRAGTPLLMTDNMLATVQANAHSLIDFSSDGKYLGNFPVPTVQGSGSLSSMGLSPAFSLLSAIDPKDVFFALWEYVGIVNLNNLSGPGLIAWSGNGIFPNSISSASLVPGKAPFMVELVSDSIYIDSVYYGLPQKIFSTFPGDTIVSGPVIADLDGDGNRDIIFATQTKVYAISYTGAVLNHFPISTVGSEILSPDANRIVGSIVVADLDGDGKPEVIFGTKGGTLCAFTGATGQIFPGFPVSIGGGLAGSPAVTYDSQSGNLYLAAIGFDGYLYSWTFKGSSSTQVVWGNLLHDNFHSNSITTPLQTVPPPPSDTLTLMPTAQVYNWPNPVTNGLTKIHFYLRDNAQVSISIFSFAGHKVADFQTSGTAGVANEIDWNVSGVQSGVYFARVEAVSSNKRDVAIIKIAVVK